MIQTKFFLSYELDINSAVLKFFGLHNLSKMCFLQDGLSWDNTSFKMYFNFNSEAQST